MACPEQQNPLDQFLEELRSNQDLQCDSFSANLHSQTLFTKERALSTFQQSTLEQPAAPQDPICQITSQQQPAPGTPSLELEVLPGMLALSAHCE